MALGSTNGKTQTTFDPATMSIADLQAIIEGKKQEQAALVREKGMEARKDVEAYCLKKHGLSLQAIFTASDKVPVTYKDPATGKTYAGRGKRPSWLAGHEAEYVVQ